MLKNHTFIGLVCALLLVSCKKDTLTAIDTNHQDMDVIVLSERESKEPFILSRKLSTRTPNKQSSISSLSSTLTSQLDLKYYLGRSYDTSLSEIGSPEGVGFSVIDIDKLILNNPDYYLPKRLGISEANRFSFSSFERYQEKANTTRKISGGFSLNLGLFTIGSKNKFDRTFSSEVINENKRIFGELNITVRDASYELLISSNTLSKIKENYLHNTFLDELYNTPSSEFVDNYGGFVITNFFSGGRANALFTGIYNLTSDNETKERSMDNSISGSYNFKENTDSSIELGIGNTNGSTIAQSNNIFNFTASVKTYGGSYGISSFTVPKSIDDINIDLASWTSSLSDRSNHVLVDVNDNGIRPIADFIMEDNFRHNINSYLENKLSSKPFREPRIEARWIRISHNMYGFATIVLVTRFGDELVISPNHKQLAFSMMDEMLAFAKAEAQTKLPFYKLKAVATEAGAEYYHNYSPNYINTIVDINEATMKKFYDERYKTLYLLSEADGRKFAYAVHDDYILDTYGIRQWVDGMVSKQITYLELSDYTIVGL